MLVAGSPQQKKTSLFGSRQSPVLNSPIKQGKPIGSSSAKTSRCFRGFNDCMTMGTTVSTSQEHQHQHHHQSTSKLEQQAEELKREVRKQKELRIIYRKRMERTQDYLRYCLQIAQENGLLELMTNNKEHQHQHQYLLSTSNNVSIEGSPALQTPPYQYHSAQTPMHQYHSDQSPLHQQSDQTILYQQPSDQSPLHQQQLERTPFHHQHSDQTPLYLQSDLSVTTNQAKTNGWHIDPSEIELKEKIGQGSTADIYRAIWRGLDVAVKCIYPDFFQLNEKGVTFFAQELDTLSRQRHRFVLQLMGACLEPPHHGWLVTEFLSMTLKEWLHGPGRSRQKERRVLLAPFEERLAKALEISQAMQYLHEQKPKVIHRDLKPSNIFLDDAKHVRVADFGHARFLTDEGMALTGETGTYVYMAPEVIRCEPYNEKCDVYSFGIILNELITGNHPYIETDYGPTKIAMEVAEDKLRPELPDDDGEVRIMGELIELICISWDGDASVRPSFSSITCRLRNLIQKKLQETTRVERRKSI